MHLVSAGVADFETIDRSFRNSIGLWATLCGPFRWIDLTGGPALYSQAMQPVLPVLNNAVQSPQWLEEMRANGARGIANGEGFFSYAPAEAQAWEERYRRHSWTIKRLVDEVRPMKEET
jgi:3-hydroxybutyryl-CoA dehydrogenase